MTPAESPQHTTQRQADQQSFPRNRAQAGSQVPAPPVRPARPVSLHFSRGQLPATPGAACVAHDPELWFSHIPQHIAKAKAICHRCPAQAQCLTGAVQRRETHGILGGIDLNPEHHQEDAA